MTRHQLPHLVVEGFFSTEKYAAAPRRGPDFPLPARERAAHGTSVREQLQKVRGENEENRGVHTEPDVPVPICLEVRSKPGFKRNLDSLENRYKGIEVSIVRQEGDVQVAAIHIPDGALTHFLKRVEEYVAAETRKGNPKHNDLIARIDEVRLATIQTLWEDDSDCQGAR